MTVKFLANRRQRRALQRAISVLLLSFCFFDLAIADVLFPGSCDWESEFGSIIVSTSSILELHPGSVTLANAEQENRRAPAESSSADDGCFCCCTHIVPVAFYRPSHPRLPVAPITPFLQSIPSTPPAELYRPPRLA